MLTRMTGQRSPQAYISAVHKAIQKLKPSLIDSDTDSVYHLCGLKKSKSALSFSTCGRWTLNWQNRPMNPRRPNPSSDQLTACIVPRARVRCRLMASKCNELAGASCLLPASCMPSDWQFFAPPQICQQPRRAGPGACHRQPAHIPFVKMCVKDMHTNQALLSLLQHCFDGLM